MKKFKWKSVQVKALLGAAIAVAAVSSEGAAITYNFDLTGLSPSPVYDAIVLNYVYFSTPTTIFCSVFDELDLGGSSINGCAQSDSNPITYNTPGMMDGIFSLRFATDAITSQPSVYGIKHGVKTDILLANGRTIPQSSVPEPVSLALVGMALAAASLARRRKA